MENRFDNFTYEEIHILREAIIIYQEGQSVKALNIMKRLYDELDKLDVIHGEI
jgi:hypothetical protein